MQPPGPSVTTFDGHHGQNLGSLVCSFVEAVRSRQGRSPVREFPRQLPEADPRRWHGGYCRLVSSHSCPITTDMEIRVADVQAHEMPLHCLVIQIIEIAPYCALRLLHGARSFDRSSFSRLLFRCIDD